MAAPRGNQFWKLRSKHGRERLFSTPELMWEAACEYFEWCDKHPLFDTDFRGKDATRVKIPKPRPYTLQGLCLYMGCDSSYFRNFRAECREKNLKEFSAVLARIEEIVYNQKFEGASVGLFNASIIAHDLGLLRKQQEQESEQANNQAPAPTTIEIKVHR